MSQAVAALTTSPLSIEDVKTVDDRPRIMDLRLAEALGFSLAYDIRKLIGRHLEALERFGEVFATVAKTPETKGGRPGKSYWLNKKQALYICTKSETEKATETTIQMVEVFDAYLGKRLEEASYQPGELWINFGKTAVMVDPKAAFIGAGQRAVICDHLGKLQLVWGPLAPCDENYAGERKVWTKARKRGVLSVRYAATLIGRVIPFVPCELLA
jgi:hypothetical protein